MKEYKDHSRQICQHPIHFQPPIQTKKLLVLDLWARAWHALDGRFATAEQADFWSALMRVPASASLALQQVSGQHGVYLEPRSSNGRETDGRYQVVWLAESFSDAMCKVRSTPHALALVRLQKKFGIRFLKEHAEDAFSALRPGEVYTAISVSKLWRLMPLPFGTRRVGLQKCLSDLNWPAKVLQQVGSTEQDSSGKSVPKLTRPLVCYVFRIGT